MNIKKIIREEIDSDWDFVRDVDYNHITWTEELLDETLKDGSVINISVTGGKGSNYDMFYNDSNDIELINVDDTSIFLDKHYYGYSLGNAAIFLNNTWVINDIK